MKLTGWWSRRSKPQKVELYTRWSYHLFVLLEVAAIGLGVLGRASAPLAGWLFLLVTAHAALGAVVSSRALDWVVGRRARPAGLMVAHGFVSGVLAAGVLTLLRFGDARDLETVATMVVGLLGFGVCAIVLGIPDNRHVLLLVLAAAGGTGLWCLLLGMPAPEVAGFTIGVLIAALFLAGTSGFSAWLLRTVWELDAARELQARLAVAEERLRFGRDLHDVMGRNLSVVALKSELAVRLARRGSTEAAVDQMTEVQRIARESQREVRDVVRGYREADLHTELEGARSVLAAAGITCTVREPDVELPAAVQSALAWVVREGTTNVLRHGDARACSVSVRAEKGCAVLVVENDGADGVSGAASGSGARSGTGASLSGARSGTGASLSGAGSSPSGAGADSDSGTGTGTGTDSGAGSGLAGLRERLAALDGTLEAGRAGDGRFRLTARVPAGAAVPEGAR
ncbi:sensor histidine kinase [Streptomyces sp. NPDC015131]|uniref:sensor histidine kinase n=1 Tax=Streptomyces sp. NPDC015131 TaxID=3364941 RepID=UPI0036FB55B1